MNQLRAAIDYLLSPSAFSGPSGWGTLALEHIGISLLSVGLVCLVAIPVGWAIGHTGRGSGLLLGLATSSRALPTLGVITLLGLWLGIGLSAPVLALMVLALPSVLAGAMSGIRDITPSIVDAAYATGMSRAQVLWRVQIPLGLPQLIAGLRAAVVQVIATATLAAYVGAGGLGQLIFLGLKTANYPLMVAGSLLVIIVAIIFELIFAVVLYAARRAYPSATH